MFVMPSKPTNRGIHDKPLASPGFISYRYIGRYGYIHIGARNNAEALKEASRSTSDTIDPGKLEIWDDKILAYTPAT